MRRTSLLTLSVVVLLGALLAGGGTLVAAQGAATPVAEGHPLVGSWILNTDAENPDNPLSLGNFSADGTYIEVDAGGEVGLGAWEPTGDSTANLTFSFLDDEGGIVRIRASIEVDAGGRSFKAAYTIEFYDPATGEWSGEIGPGTAVGTRVVTEGPGTPVASFEDIQGSAEATPAG